ncbi:hypothetical protein DL96DRAFT_1706595 [Flagelloscypha sp. PMI_526]|nr:hypothetical protein DL96DRAFT_1706595 [Flagelloscypha sp. PMI_526]
MAARDPPAPEHDGITALALDGSAKHIHALSELYILQEVAGCWAFNKGLSLRGEEVRPIDMFDIIGGTGTGGFYAILFGRLKMTIEQAIKSHAILEQLLFNSDAWINESEEVCVENLNAALDKIVNDLGIKTSLDSQFEENSAKSKCFVSLINTAAAASCRLLRNYRPRKGQGPRCTIREVLHASLSNQVQIPAVCIQEERFLSALKGYANPTHVLVKELCNAFAKGTQVACLVNIGAGHPGVQPLAIQKNVEYVTSLLHSCQLVADDVATQCHDLGPFYFRLSVSSGLELDAHCLGSNASQVIGLTMAYLSTDDISTRLDDLERMLRERFGIVSIERLNSVAGKDGESQLGARLAKIEEHLNGTIIQDVINWLQPIHQTSKLDANIRARSGSTCQWLWENSTFMRWVKAGCGLFWFHGLMGTGKTVMSSFVIDTLFARDDASVAYYYFEFTNPATLSEESLLRSLVCQLAVSAPAVVQILHQKHSNGSFRPQLTTLQATLNELVTASSKPVFIIIDALDELPLTQRKYLLQFHVAFSASKSASQTHIMVTSRGDIDIHRALKEKADFELEVQGDLVRQDIAAFVDGQLKEEKWTFWSLDDIEMTRRLLIERADGQFRMVACQADVLQHVKTPKQLQQALHSLPKTLSETYNYILGNIPEHLRAQAHRLFAILSFTSDTIYIDELAALLALDFGDEEDPDQLPEFREMDCFVDPFDVVDLGTSLVSQREIFGGITIQLAHASVKEHLLFPSGAWFFLFDDLARGMVARSCLALVLRFDNISSIHQPETIAELCPYSRYKWFEHVVPNGPAQLLRQQEHMYAAFEWPRLLHQSKFNYRQAHSPLVSAASFGLFDLVVAILNAQPWQTDIIAEALVAAASSDRAEPISIQCCRVLMACGADVNKFTKDITFSYASSYIVNFFKAAFFDCPQPPPGASFPLQGASLVGNLKIVQFLLENGADINAVRGYYGPALQASAFSGKFKIVRFLAENGADLNALGGHFGTALQAAASNEHLGIVCFLVEKGARVNAVGGHFGTALQAGASSGSLDVIHFLVEKGADVTASGGQFGFALQAGASHREGLGVVRFLIDQGADVNEVGGYFGTALQAGASEGHLEIIHFLVDQGADVNKVGGHFGTALQAGASDGCLKVVQFLVEKGADVNKVGGYFGTALQAGASRGHLEIVHFLVEKGADVNAVGGKYKTALDAAQTQSPCCFRPKDKCKVEQFLRSCGAKSWEEMLDTSQ